MDRHGVEDMVGAPEHVERGHTQRHACLKHPQYKIVYVRDIFVNISCRIIETNLAPITNR